MKVCVLGAGGLLGHMLIRVLGESVDVYGTTRESRSISSPLAKFLPQDKWIDNIDASKFDSLNKVFGTSNFDTVINCIGLIKQRNTQTTEHEMMLINAEFPHRLAQVANQHVSQQPTSAKNANLHYRTVKSPDKFLSRNASTSFAVIKKCSELSSSKSNFGSGVGLETSGRSDLIAK